jgi:hypothetical protein
MKNEGLIVKMNPKWRDLISEWEEKYGLDFLPDGSITRKENQPQLRNKGSFDSGLPR